MRGIGYEAFHRCEALTSIDLPKRLITIESGAFSDCKSLAAVVLPDAVTQLGSSAFARCESLSRATIGSKVTQIPDKLFNACTALHTVYCKAVTPPFMASENAFASYNDAVLYVPNQSLAAYKDAFYWYRFGLILGMDFSDPFDVNGDGEVNIADVNMLIDIVLSGEENARGDVNGDHEINIADINTVIDAILSGSN